MKSTPPRGMKNLLNRTVPNKKNLHFTEKKARVSFEKKNKYKHIFFYPHIQIIPGGLTKWQTTDWLSALT